MENGVDSFLTNNYEEWLAVLMDILEKKVDFGAMGKLARKKIMGNYTFSANTKKYVDFVTSAKNNAPIQRK